MNAGLPIPVIQLFQVLTIAVGAPGVSGVISLVEARLQGRFCASLAGSPA